MLPVQACGLDLAFSTSFYVSIITYPSAITSALTSGADCKNLAICVSRSHFYPVIKDEAVQVQVGERVFGSSSRKWQPLSINLLIPQHIPIKTLAKFTQVLAREAKFACLFIVASDTFCNGPFNNSHTLTGKQLRWKNVCKILKRLRAFGEFSNDRTGTRAGPGLYELDFISMGKIMVANTSGHRTVFMLLLQEKDQIPLFSSNRT